MKKLFTLMILTPFVGLSQTVTNYLVSTNAFPHFLTNYLSATQFNLTQYPLILTNLPPIGTNANATNFVYTTNFVFATNVFTTNDIQNITGWKTNTLGGYSNLGKITINSNVTFVSRTAGPLEQGSPLVEVANFNSPSIPLSSPYIVVGTNAADSGTILKFAGFPSEAVVGMYGGYQFRSSSQGSSIHNNTGDTFGAGVSANYTLGVFNSDPTFTALALKASTAQAANLFELVDINDNLLSGADKDGKFFGDGAGLTNINNGTYITNVAISGVIGLITALTNKPNIQATVYIPTTCSSSCSVSPQIFYISPAPTTEYLLCSDSISMNSPTSGGIYTFTLRYVDDFGLNTIVQTLDLTVSHATTNCVKAVTVISTSNVEWSYNYSGVTGGTAAVRTRISLVKL